MDVTLALLAGVGFGAASAAMVAVRLLWQVYRDQRARLDGRAGIKPGEGGRERDPV
jgi:hypothetical protein